MKSEASNFIDVLCYDYTVQGSWHRREQFFQRRAQKVHVPEHKKKNCFDRRLYRTASKSNVLRPTSDKYGSR